MARTKAISVVAASLVAATCLSACSPRSYMVRRAADAFSSAGGSFASDDDPELVRDAAPFGLKTMETLLAEAPGHRGLLTALSRGFTQYAAAFVAQDALEAPEPEQTAGKERALRLYMRAREYGLRGLAAAHAGFRERLETDSIGAAGMAGPDDVPLLYWTALSWSLAIASSRDDPSLMADLPRCEALMRRALALREDFDGGAIHEYFIAFEGSRPEAMGGSAARAREHFLRAMEIARGEKVSPLVTLAETVSVREQNRAEFLDLLDRALAFDAQTGPPGFRLANLIAQRRARWLKGRADDLFLE